MTLIDEPQPIVPAEVPVPVKLGGGPLVYLPYPKCKPLASLCDVLESRRTVKRFDRLDIAKLSNVLWYSAKTRCRVVDDLGITRRTCPLPSAGALHSVWIVLQHPIGGIDQLHAYDRDSHTLQRVDATPDDLRAVRRSFNRIVDSQEGTIIWLAVDYNLMSSVYRNSESLALRDAGVLTAGVCLVAEAFGLACCPVGLLGKPLWSRVRFPEGVYGVGGLVIGEPNESTL